jgi:hypothetical protein
VHPSFQTASLAGSAGKLVMPAAADESRYPDEYFAVHRKGIARRRLMQQELMHWQSVCRCLLYSKLHERPTRGSYDSSAFGSDRLQARCSRKLQHSRPLNVPRFLKSSNTSWANAILQLKESFLPNRRKRQPAYWLGNGVKLPPSRTVIIHGKKWKERCCWMRCDGCFISESDIRICGMKFMPRQSNR